MIIWKDCLDVENNWKEVGNIAKDSGHTALISCCSAQRTKYWQHHRQKGLFVRCSWNGLIVCHYCNYSWKKRMDWSFIQQTQKKHPNWNGFSLDVHPKLSSTVTKSLLDIFTEKSINNTKPFFWLSSHLESTTEATKTKFNFTATEALDACKHIDTHRHRVILTKILRSSLSTWTALLASLMNPAVWLMSVPSNV